MIEERQDPTKILPLTIQAYEDPVTFQAVAINRMAIALEKLAEVLDGGFTVNVNINKEAL